MEFTVINITTLSLETIFKYDIKDINLKLIDLINAIDAELILLNRPLMYDLLNEGNLIFNNMPKIDSIDTNKKLKDIFNIKEKSISLTIIFSTSNNSPQDIEELNNNYIYEWFASYIRNIEIYDNVPTFNCINNTYLIEHIITLISKIPITHYNNINVSKKLYLSLYSFFNKKRIILKEFTKKLILKNAFIMSALDQKDPIRNDIPFIISMIESNNDEKSIEYASQHILKNIFENSELTSDLNHYNIDEIIKPPDIKNNMYHVIF